MQKAGILDDSHVLELTCDQLGALSWLQVTSVCFLN